MNSDVAQLLIAQNKKTYNSIACDFSASRNRTWSELEIFIKKYIKDGDDILDIGCGNGRLFGVLSENGSPTSSVAFNYTGIDVSEKLINEAKNKFLNSKYNPNFLVNDILNLNYINKFDVVFCIAVLNHIPSIILREKAVENIFKSLKPDGYFLMTNWNLWNFSSKKSWWKLKYPTLFGGNNLKSGKTGGIQIDLKDVITYWGEEKLPLYYHAFTKNEIKNLLKKSGFKIIENNYSLDYKKSKWWKAKNLMTISQRCGK
jgi:2-polyprenyl-3-methyl-5-hydroxy-6-metoxy-1,4-benzoquinol methylase